MTPAEEIRDAAARQVADHLKPGVLGHILHGQRTGDFLAAVFANDLSQAVMRADPVSLNALPALMRFLYNDAPTGCWGSRAAVDNWRYRGGLLGWHESAVA